MLDTYRLLTVQQFEASLCTLNACIDHCPDSAWNAPVGKLAFCQVVFHTLFYVDLYLGPDEESFAEQPFHRANEDVFRDYEELQDRAQELFYEKPWIKTYLEYCRKKAADVILSETGDSLAGNSGFHWLKFSRAEAHVYNIRHIQHHAAQLSLRLRLDHGIEIPWFGSGWRES